MESVVEDFHQESEDESQDQVPLVEGFQLRLNPRLGLQDSSGGEKKQDDVLQDVDGVSKGLFQKRSSPRSVSLTVAHLDVTGDKQVAKPVKDNLQELAEVVHVPRRVQLDEDEMNETIQDDKA